jgi:hypothetical protein
MLRYKTAEAGYVSIKTYSKVLSMIEELRRDRQRPLRIVLADIPHGRGLGHGARRFDVHGGIVKDVV